MHTLQKYLPRSDLIVFLRAIVAFFMLMGIWSSHKAWLSSQRLFPTAPILPDWPGLISPLDQLLPILLTVLLILTVFARRALLFASLLAALLGVAFFMDQTRLQPWCFQYTGMLLALSTTKREDEESENAAIVVCRIIIACLYIFSGLHKLNSVFANEIFGWLISGLSVMKVTSYAVPPAVAYSFGMLESVIGIALLIRPIRLVGVVLAILMHITLLTCLGPGGLNWNSVVWPWNFAMVFFVVILFALIKDVSVRSLLSHKFLALCTLALFVVAPVFSFFGLWDYYPSFALYAGDSCNGDLEISKDVYDRLPRPMQTVCLIEEGKPIYLNIGNWSTGEIQLPCYPQRRVLITIARKFARQFKTGDIVLRIRRGVYAWEQGGNFHEEEVPISGQ